MIFTRFGTPVTILSADGEWLTVRCEPKDGAPYEREWHIFEFKADGGIDEIQQAIDALSNDQQS